MEVTDQLYEYIHHDTFKEDILNSVQSSTRFSIEKNLDEKLQKATIEWQQIHIEDIFNRVIGENLIQKFSMIHTRMDFIRSEMTGIITEPDVNNRITSALAPGGILVGGIVLSRLLVSPGLEVFTVLGLAFTGITLFVNREKHETLCARILMSRINALTKEKISTAFRERFAGLVESMIKRLLDGDLKNEINNMKKNVQNMQENHMKFKSMTAFLQSLMDEVNQRQAHLKRIESSEINLD